MPPDVFPGRDEPVAIGDDPEEALKLLLTQEVGEGDPEAVEPILDQ
jgi:hypothetical protein